MTPDDFCRVIQGQPLSWLGPRAATITCATIDVKEVGAGVAFFALSQLDYSNNCFNGTFADTSRLIPEALANGAPVCVLRRESYKKHEEWLSCYRNALIVVDDAIIALQRFAQNELARAPTPVIGVTGSAGKTTTKELIAYLLSSAGFDVVYSAGNRNNGLGLPLTLQKIGERRYDVAVLEMGMSTRENEIARLCKIVPPDIAVVLNVLPVHIEYLGTLESVQQAKGQIVENMKNGGTAVLSADDARVSAMQSKAATSITFGLDACADVRATDVEFLATGTQFTLHRAGESIAVHSLLRGEHNVMNMLAATAACSAYAPSVGLPLIAKSFAAFLPPLQRSREFLLKEEIVLIDDTYNSNPVSLQLAAKAARTMVKPDGRLIVVAGGMHELGPESDRLHHESGAALADAGVDLLFGVGERAAVLVAGFKMRSSGLSGRFDHILHLAAVLNGLVRPGDVLLVKGSRAERLERLVQHLCQSRAQTAGSARAKYS